MSRQCPDMRTLQQRLKIKQTTQGKTNKHSMTNPKGNREFRFSQSLNVPWAKPRGTLRSRGNKIHCFTRDQSWSALLYLSTKKWKKSKKSFAWRRLNDKYAEVSRSTTWSRGSRKFLLFPKGVSKFVCPRELVSIYPRHVILPRLIEKRILVGTYNNNSLRVAKA